MAIDVNITTAIIAGIVALFTALFTTIASNFQWKKEFLLKFEEPKLAFLKNLVERRFQVYPVAFELLGAVRDFDPDGDHHNSLISNPTQLRPVGADLLKQLYSEAGLLMSFDTRNALLEVCQDCERYAEGKVTLQKVISDFFYARRFIRADLQLEDIEVIKSELQKRKTRYSLSVSNLTFDNIMMRTSTGSLFNHFSIPISSIRHPGSKA